MSKSLRIGIVSPVVTANPGAHSDWETGAGVADLVRIAADSSSFVAAVEQAAAEARRPDLVAARRAFAAEHSWRSRADQLAEALGLAAAVQPGT